MPSTYSDRDRRSRLAVSAGMVAVVLAFLLVSGFLIHGWLHRPYVQVTGDEELPATTAGLGRAVTAMHDLHYLCTEGRPAREGLRAFVCSGPEGRVEIEATAAGKVTFLALIGRADEMTQARAEDVGRVLVNAADLGQDAKIAARSIADGRAEMSTGPWGTAMKGSLPYRLVFVAADRPRIERAASLGPVAKLGARLAKQNCRTEGAPSPSPSGSGSLSAQPTGTGPATTASAAPPAAPPAAPSAAPSAAASKSAVVDPSVPKGPLTACTSSNRLVTTTVSYVTVGDQVTDVTVRSSAPFAFGWTHTEAIKALREAMADLGHDAAAIGDWAAENSDRQGAVALESLIVDLNHEPARSVTSVSVTRVP